MTDTGPFDPPPRSFEDAEGRRIDLRVADDDDEERVDSLVEMYDDFDSEERAQGLPPVGESRIRGWLSTLFEGGGHNVVAFHGDRAVGHATLVPDDEAYELAIFVHQPYQGAGIGTALMEALLRHAAEAGVERVWLTVERWNHAAVGLYEKLGFERTNGGGFVLEMEATLD